MGRRADLRRGAPEIAKAIHPIGVGQVPYILVLQWPASSQDDFDALISMEDDLDEALGDGAAVDGHDFGSGEMNIFIETDRPTEAFSAAMATLGDRLRWAEVRAAYRDATGDAYTVLWPQGLREFSLK
jgi:hypothetical protein